MSSPNGFSKKTVSLEGRSFSLRVEKFENGYFVSISEGSDKLGAMVVSLASGPSPVTTTIIPSKFESLFLQLLAESISTQVKGISIISSSIQKELKNNTAKALMSEIMGII